MKHELLEQVPRFPPARIHQVNGALFPNESFIQNLENIGGYDPLLLRAYMQLLQELTIDPPHSFQIDLSEINPEEKLLDLLDVHFILKLEKDSGSQFYLEITERTKNQRRIVFHDDARFLPENCILSEIGKPSFNPSTQLILSDEEPLTNLNPCGKSLPENLAVSFNHVAPMYMDITADVPCDGYLRFSEIFYPGWEAYINKMKTKILKGNFLFRTVPVTGSRVDLTLVYFPFDFKLGLYLSLVGIAMVFSIMTFRFL